MKYTVAPNRDQTVASDFQVQAIPQAWLLDKDGRVVWSDNPLQLDLQTGTTAVPRFRGLI